MLGFGAVGQFALGQDESAPTQGVLSGVYGTGAVGTIIASVGGALTGVAGTGALGTLTVIVSSTSVSYTLTGVRGTGAVGTIAVSASRSLTGVYGTAALGTITPVVSPPVNAELTLANVLRRMRLLGNWQAGRSRNMYVGRDFDPANPAENEVYSLDFVNELATSETLLSVSSVGLTVFQGTDANPSSHLSGGASISGTIVSQRLATLTAGVTYTLSFTVLTSLSNTITLFSRVACRPVQ